MPISRHWTIGLAASFGILGLTATSCLAVLAHYFVDEFSRPHETLTEDQFTFELPKTEIEPPEIYKRSITFQTSDGVLLRGDFWAQSHPAPTIVICHGYRVSRTHLKPVASLEYHSGYNILLFDFRGHGHSESKATSGGNAEVRDLEAALNVAGQQPETCPGQIVIHGFSMGAAIALLTPPHPDVAAIIADSPYARLDEVLRKLVHYRLTLESVAWKRPFQQLRNAFPALAWVTVTASAVDFQLRHGLPLVARPDMSFKRWRERAKRLSHPRQTPVLLIHSMEDALIPIAHAHQLAARAKANNVPIETYFVEHGGHCGAYGHDPERYVAILQTFVSQTLDAHN